MKKSTEQALSEARKNSLKNLEKRVKFTSETARAAAPKSAKKRSENIKYRKATEASLNRLLDKGALKDLTKDFKNLKTFEKLAILEHLRDSSGQKPKDAPEAVIMPVINIKGL